MADLKKVIKGLECCVVSDEECECPEACPYYDECWESVPENGLALKKDALELLKAQQPRMLTVEEVKVSEGKDLILEYRPWGCEDSIVTAATIEGCGSRGVSFVMSVSCEYTAYNRDHTFGWRCWSTRPTDAERKAVKWNE